MIITRRSLAILLIPLLVGGCDRPESDEVVRSDPPVVSSPQGSGAAPAAPAAPATPLSADPRPVVLFLGTSLTEGLGLSSGELPYPERIQRRIDREGLPFRVVNAGVSGDTSAGGLARLDWVLRSPVDVLVVELGANDGLRGLPISALEENLRTVVRKAREANPEMEVVLLAMEAPPNLGLNYVADFRATFSRVAEQEDVLLVPFFLEGIAGIPGMNQSDGIHPTAEGHELMADRIWTVLEPVLRSSAADRQDTGDAA
jgi:acyl-CoA thioesterase I